MGMRVKITKLMPFTEANKKYQTQTMVVDNQPYYISHTSIDKKGEHYVGLPFIVHLHCAMPDPNLDYEYLRCDLSVEKQTTKETIFKDNRIFKDLRKPDLRRQHVFEMVPPTKGPYKIHVHMAWKARPFVQGSQQP